jgi:hypothetical protein
VSDERNALGFRVEAFRPEGRSSLFLRIVSSHRVRIGHIVGQMTQVLGAFGGTRWRSG